MAAHRQWTAARVGGASRPSSASTRRPGFFRAEADLDRFVNIRLADGVSPGRDRFSLQFRIGVSAALMRFICASVTISPRIFGKRSSFRPDPMYCQRSSVTRKVRG